MPLPDPVSGLEFRWYWGWVANQAELECYAGSYDAWGWKQLRYAGQRSDSGWHPREYYHCHSEQCFGKESVGGMSVAIPDPSVVENAG